MAVNEMVELDKFVRKDEREFLKLKVQNIKQL